MIALLQGKVVGIMEALGLTVCQDTQVGTIYKRGISGGQQRRTCMAIELIAGAPVTLMDEPTSGLDTTTAVKCLEYLHSGITGTDRGALVSIHQPNNEMLSYFDDIIMLVDGECMYFGTCGQAVAHFDNIGVHAPSSDDIPVTEHYLLESDNIYGLPALDMVQGYEDSELNRSNLNVISAHQTNSSAVSQKDTAAGVVSQVGYLFGRMWMVSKRDLTLYYLQFSIQIVYGFLVGALFWDASKTLDDTVETAFNTVTWVTALMIYIFVFKVMYFNDVYLVQQHERANSMYNVMTVTFADLLINLLLFPGYLLGGIIAYFMIGFASEGFAYTLLNYYVGVFAAEKLPDLIVQFTAPNLGMGFIVTQGVLLILFMFSGGTFIRNEEVEGTFWVWLQKISPFYHAGDSFSASTWRFMSYRCPLEQDNVNVIRCNTTLPSMALNGAEYCCDSSLAALRVFPCDSVDSLTHCESEGLTVMEIFKGITPDMWDSIGYLFLVGVGFRVMVLVLQIYAPSVLIQGARKMLCGKSGDKPVPSAGTRKTVPNNGGVARATNREDSTIIIKGADLFIKNITVQLKKKLPCQGPGRNLIKGLSSVARKGEIMALMGPSGAGKTTLLNALSGMAPYAKVTGSCKLGNQPLSKNVLGYVPQFDVLIEGFTIRETLMYSFTLKCDTSEDATGIVEEVAKVVGLDHLIDKRISALTSGQRKLVSIADGLISRPTVLFLDEPTTGLDSTAAHEVVSHIASICKSGVTVIMTIHQPSSDVFKMLDSMLLLDKTGNIAFDGPAALAKEHFALQGFPTGPNDNPADVFLSAMDNEPSKAANWAEAFTANTTIQNFLIEANKNAVQPAEKIEPVFAHPSEFTRVMILIRRFSLLYYRVPDFYLYRFVVIACFGGLAGTLYANTPHETTSLTEVTGCIFFSVWCSLYLALGNIPACFKNRFDGQNGYATGRHSIASWCLAQFVASLAYVMMCALVFIVLVHFIPQINDSAECFLYVLLMSWIMQLIMEAVDWNLLEVLKNELLTVTAGMVVIGTFFIFAGFFIPIEEMVRPIFWMAYMVPTKYVYPRRSIFSTRLL